MESKGYIKLSTNEMQHKDGGPIQLLSKKGQFGAELRQGKVGEKGKGTSGSRITPCRHGKRPCGGTIIGS